MYRLYDVKRRKQYVLTGIMKEIGRASECDICITKDELVSRMHARLDWDGNAWIAVDLDSTNGTFVNGNRIGEHRLEVGDVLEIGDTQYQFLVLEDTDAIERKKTTKVDDAVSETKGNETIGGFRTRR